MLFESGGRRCDALLGMAADVQGGLNFARFRIVLDQVVLPTLPVAIVGAEELSRRLRRGVVLRLLLVANDYLGDLALPRAHQYFLGHVVVLQLGRLIQVCSIVLPHVVDVHAVLAIALSLVLRARHLMALPMPRVHLTTRQLLWI